ncbi:MAG: NlpC/P60 family protein [Isosphaeraceae bacterium]|nr:NlpC/P60 family protein [Isosphaeraceae bacterium]
MVRKVAVPIVLAVAAALLGTPVRAQSRPVAPAETAYRSPYRVEFTQPLADLVGDLERSERGDFRLEAEVPYSQWYGSRTLERWHSWGPSPRTYPPLAGAETWSVERKRERVVAVALRYVGYGYQHHHIPDWNPPPEWPWKPTCVGHNSKGVDCSNFTGFVYNLGFGMRLNTAVEHQSEERAAIGPGAGRTPLHRVELPESYDERIKVLRTGDLLFIKNRGGKISHVVLWIGSVGRSPDGLPLILDSHGEGVHDSDGATIPCGIQLRPFRKNSWYNHSASHALRVFRDRTD